MPKASVSYSSTSPSDVQLAPSPINADWIVGGQPLARSAILSRSQDKTACTIMWDCTSGEFHWYYDFDETVHFLEGEVVIDDGEGPRPFGPGDVLFFPAGSSALWRVDTYVRKLAFCRKALPAPLGLAVKALRSMRNAMRRSQPESQSLMQVA